MDRIKFINLHNYCTVFDGEQCIFLNSVIWFSLHLRLFIFIAQAKTLGRQAEAVSQLQVADGVDFCDSFSKGCLPVSRHGEHSTLLRESRRSWWSLWNVVSNCRAGRNRDWNSCSRWQNVCVFVLSSEEKKFVRFTENLSEESVVDAEGDNEEDSVQYCCFRSDRSLQTVQISFENPQKDYSNRHLCSGIRSIRKQRESKDHNCPWPV